MTETISKVLIYVSIFFTALPVIVGFTLYKHLKTYLIPVLFICVTGTITEAIVYYIVKSGKDPYLMNMLYTSMEFTFVILFYYLFYKVHFDISKIILTLIPFFYGVCVLTYLTAEEKLYGSYSISIEALVVSLFALGSFVFLLRKMLFKNILSEPFFYINTGFLFYFLGNLTFFAMGSYIKQMDASSYIGLQIIHSILNISLNVLMSIGFWKAKTIWE
jgi:hypothetical protein